LVSIFHVPLLILFIGSIGWDERHIDRAFFPSPLLLSDTFTLILLPHDKLSFLIGAFYLIKNDLA
jgi:hypothetical protein